MAGTPYTDIDVALSNANEVVYAAAEKNGWSATQRDSALDDVHAAYEANTGIVANAELLLDFDIWKNAFLNTDVLLNPSEQTLSDIKLAMSFWADLYKSAKAKWATYPNVSETLLWLASASGAATVAADTEQTSSPTEVVAGGVAGTATTIAKATDTTATVLSDSRFWYGLAAVATLGAVGYFVRAFR